MRASRARLTVFGTANREQPLASPRRFFFQSARNIESRFAIATAIGDLAEWAEQQVTEPVGLGGSDVGGIAIRAHGYERALPIELLILLSSSINHSCQRHNRRFENGRSYG